MHESLKVSNLASNPITRAIVERIKGKLNIMRTT